MRYSLWFKLRKWTVPAHWLFGVLCAVVATQYFPAAIVLLSMFAAWEVWNDWCEDSKDGAADFWDAFFIFCIGLSVAVILNLVGVIGFKWH